MDGVRCLSHSSDSGPTFRAFSGLRDGHLQNGGQCTTLPGSPHCKNTHTEGCLGGTGGLELAEARQGCRLGAPRPRAAALQRFRLPRGVELEPTRSGGTGTAPRSVSPRALLIPRGRGQNCAFNALFRYRVAPLRPQHAHPPKRPPFPGCFPKRTPPTHRLLVCVIQRALCSVRTTSHNSGFPTQFKR